jgi:hypothetical protein
VLVSKNQSIDIHYIVLPVKIDAGLPISDLRISNSSKSSIFNVQTPPIEEMADLGKRFIFLEPIFLVNGMDNPTSNLTQT